MFGSLPSPPAPPPKSVFKAEFIREFILARASAVTQMTFDVDRAVIDAEKAFDLSNKIDAGGDK